MNTVLVNKLPKEKLREIVPLYFEYVGEYIRTGKRIPNELNPIYFLSQSISEMSIKEQEGLILRIEYNIKMLRLLIEKLSCCMA